MSIDPKTSLYLNILAGMLILLASGALYRPSFISVTAAHDIVGIAGGLSFVLNMVLHALSSGTPGPAASKTGPASTSLCLALVGLSVVFALSEPGRSEAATKPLSQIVADLNTKVATLTGKVNASTGLTGKPATDLKTLLTTIANASTVDLNAALDDARALNDDMAVTCYPPIIDMVNALQKSLKTPNLPPVHPILTFQHGRDLANAIRPGSTVNRACAPMALQVKMDFTTFIAAIIGGTLTAASFGL